jgi:hypothetical protein
VSPLLLAVLGTSAASLALQAGMLAHQVRQRATYGAEHLAGRGYVRTAVCRVLAAAIYTAATSLQVAGGHLSGIGALSPETLIIFIFVQSLWGWNAVMDTLIRRRLSRLHPGSRPVAATVMSAEMERLQQPAPGPRPDEKGS